MLARHIAEREADAAALIDDVLAGAHDPAALGRTMQAIAGERLGFVENLLVRGQPVPHVPIGAMLQLKPESAQLFISAPPHDHPDELNALVEELAVHKIAVEHAGLARL